MKLKSFKQSIFAIAILFAIVLDASFASATWTDPVADPIAGNIDPPINTGSSAQLKTGGMETSGFFQVSNIDASPLLRLLSSSTLSYYTDIRTYFDNANPFSIKVAGGNAGDPIELIGAHYSGGRTTALMYGDVGIGTTNPDDTLHIAKNNASPKFILERSGTAPSKWSFMPSGGALYFYDEINSPSLARVVFDPVGRIGIGVSSPSEKLDVWAGEGGATSGTFVVGSNAVTVGALNNANNMIFTVQDRLGDDYFVVASGLGRSYFPNGNVGIGLTNPNFKIHGINNSATVFSSSSRGNVILGLANTTSGVGTNNFIDLKTEANGEVLLGAVENTSNTSADFVLQQYNGSAYAEHLRVLGTSGNVGIGTAAPSEKLDVAGKVKGMELCIGADCRSAWPSGAGGTLTGSGTTGKLSKWTSGTALGDSLLTESGSAVLLNGAFEITGSTNLASSGGNVGIGTTNPIYAKMQIDDINVPLAFRETDQTGAGSLWRMPLDGKVLRFDASQNGTDFAGYVVPLSMGSDGVVNINKLNVNGNVGIGTASPGAKLEVIYGSGQQGIISVGPSGNTHLPYTDGSAYISAGNIIFRDSGNIEKMRLVGSTGNVGIGTTDPEGYKLNVAGPIKTTGLNTGGIVASLGLSVSGNSNINGLLTVNGLKTDSVSSTNGVSGLALWGVSTVDTNWGIGYVMSDGNGQLWVMASSKKYKDNIEKLDVNIENVLKLQPVKFNWKRDGMADIGLIAEDVAEIIPDLVMYDKENKPGAVKYDRLSVYLLEVVKSQQIKITDLESRLSALEAKIK